METFRSMVRVAVMFVVGGATACGSSVAIGDYPGSLEDATCEQQVRCEQMPSSSACHDAIVLAGNELETTLADVGAGVIKYDEGKAGECLDSLKNGSCTFDGVRRDDPCSHVFSGTVPVGGACVIDLECKDGGKCNPTMAGCDSTKACCPGTCGMGPTTNVAIGGACGTGKQCATTAYCKPPASGMGDGICTAPITMEGAMCDDLYACANPMICNVYANVPTCEKAPASGATCNPMALIDCADSREYCDRTTMKCVKRAAVGARCGPGVQCVGFASCINTLCVADPGLNAACTPNGPSCAGTLMCTNGTCQPPMAGMSCHM